MSKINNQAVVQKLIDELGLYPGVDIIPTELAEKILPCFIVNSQEITMTAEPSNVVRGLSTQSNGDQTVYTVPATGKFYLTGATLVGIGLPSAAGSNQAITGNLSVTIDGSAQLLLQTVFNRTNANYTPGPCSNSISLQNPILLDPSSTITINTGSGSSSAEACGTIVGYTSD